MAPELVVNVGRVTGWELLRQPSWEQLAAVIESLGTGDVFEVQLQRSSYLPERNEREYGPELTILGEDRRYHVRVCHLEEMFCYAGGDPHAVGEHYFAKADQGCGEMGLTFPSTQVMSHKEVVRDIAYRYWQTGEWRDAEHWVQMV